MIIVIDYDAGNTANVLRALKKIGVQAELSSDPTKILAARGLILPGVGAYPAAMAELTKRGLVPVIKEAVAKGAPLLGICLGMQVLTEVGLEHQETKGLGFIPGVGGKTIEKLLDNFETEMNILHRLSKDDIEAVAGEKVANSIEKARTGQAKVQSGGGGNYGKIL